MLPIWKGKNDKTGEGLRRLLEAYGISSVIGLTLLLITSLLSGCAPEADKDSILHEVNLALTRGQCSKAVSLIEPLYNSSRTDNEVRLLRASAHGCKAGINFFEVLDELASSNLAGSAFWEFNPRVFPSTADDDAMEASWLAMDALVAAVKSGASVPESFRGNPLDAFNPGTVLAHQRIADSNIYMVQVGLAVMGTMQSRYGNPNGSFLQQADLPWITRDGLGEEGCAFGAALTNFLDAVEEAQDYVDEGTAQSLDDIRAAFGNAVDSACELGCRGRNVTDTADSPDGTANLCRFNDCTGCPNLARSRTACLTDERTRCAVSGLIRFVNDDAALGWTDAP